MSKLVGRGLTCLKTQGTQLSPLSAVRQFHSRRHCCRCCSIGIGQEKHRYQTFKIEQQNRRSTFGLSQLSISSFSTSSVSSGTTQPVVWEEHGETFVRSPYPDVEVPDSGFAEYIFSKLDNVRNVEVMVDHLTDRRFTGGELLECSIKVASGLVKQGYRKGDVLLVFMSNCPEYTMLFLAAAALGMVVSTANPVYTAAELNRQLVHCKAIGVVTMPTMMGTVREALSMSEEARQNVKEIMTVNGTADGCRPFQMLVEDDGKAFPENIDINPMTDILALPYSSGTTGLPKGVMLSHSNITVNLEQSIEGQMKFRRGEDCLMGLLPFYHIYGMIPVQFGSIMQGAKLVIHPKFDPQSFLESIERHRVTYMHLVPPIVLFLSKHPMVSDFNTSALEILVSAAAPLGIGVTNELENRLGVNLIQAYGLSETSPITHYGEVPTKKGTIGQLVPSTVAKICDVESGKSLSVGEQGEITLKGPQVMLGYLDNKEATEKTVKDGWLYTGDIGFVDKDGYFTICDRMKELIKYKGNQVAPAELEQLLCTHPSVQDAAVIGIDAGEEFGEVPRAYVVHKPDMKVEVEELLQFVAKNVAPYKKLRGGLEFVDEIPKTASGKILRRKLKETAN